MKPINITTYKSVESLFFAFLLGVLSLNAIEIKAQIPFPGAVIAYTDPQNEEDGYLASPSLVIMSDGSYIVSFDRKRPTTTIHRSIDKGKTWMRMGEVPNLRWGSLFVNDGILYVIGVKNAYDEIRIVKSTDFGKSWSKPIDNKSGILFQGKYHTGSVPVFVHNGRIWRTFEQSNDVPAKRDFYSFVISAPINANLLDLSNWTKSDSVKLDPSWINGNNPFWLEGNVIAKPNGELINFMRVDLAHKGGEFELTGNTEGKKRYQTAMTIDVSSDGKKVRFENKKQNFIDFPGADSKFAIRYDPVSKKYWTVVNKITNTSDFTINRFRWQPNQRNVLMLMSSSDLVKWDSVYKVIRWSEGSKITNRDVFGFQYPDFQFDGQDIVLTSRTAWFGKWYHDGNLITFHRIEDFRKRKLSDSPEDLLKYTEKPVLLGWNFTNSITKGIEETAPSTLTDNRLNVSLLKRGKGLIINQQGLPGSFFSYAKEWPKTLKDAKENSSYYEIKIEPKLGQSISLSAIAFKVRRTADAANRYMWHYSLDGTYFYPIGRMPMETTTTAPFGSLEPKIYLSGIKALQNVSSHHPIYLRLYTWAENISSPSGSFSIGRDNSKNQTDYSLFIEGEINISK